MIATTLMLLILYAWWAPHSWWGALMGEGVRRMIDRLRSVRPLTVLCFIVVCGAFATLIVVGRFDGLFMAGLAAPVTLALFLMVDVGTAVEVMVAAWFAASQINLSRAASSARRISNVFRKGLPTRSRPRPRARRSIRAPARRTDDGEGSAPGWDLALQAL